MNLRPCLALIATLATASAAVAQDTYHKATLQQLAFPGSTYTTVTVRTIIDPSGQVGRHTHPGVEMAYVLAGRGTVTVKGEPAPRPLTVGDSFAMPPGTVHAVRNTGPKPLVLLSTYVVDKNKPIASPAP